MAHALTMAATHRTAIAAPSEYFSYSEELRTREAFFPGLGFCDLEVREFFEFLEAGIDFGSGQCIESFRPEFFAAKAAHD